MATLEKPAGITITISNRKEKKSKSFMVYGASVEEVEKKIKKIFEK